MDYHRHWLTPVLLLSLSLVFVNFVHPSVGFGAEQDVRTPTVDEIVVSLDDFQLLAKNNGEIVRAYPIATGMDTGPTPRGTFVVANKLKNPWYTPDDKPAEAPGPDNPLGTRWIGINKPSYGIHGTRDPGSIGTRASEGCVRMFNSHVEELYERVEVGTTVTIKESFDRSERRRLSQGLLEETDPSSS